MKPNWVRVSFYQAVRRFPSVTATTGRLWLSHPMLVRCNNRNLIARICREAAPLRQWLGHRHLVSLFGESSERLLHLEALLPFDCSKRLFLKTSTLNFYSQLKVGRFQLLLRAMNCALGMFDYPFSDDNDHRRSTWLPRPSGCPQGWLKQVARCSPKLSPSTRLRFSQLNRLRFSPVAFGSPRLHGEKSPRLFLWQMTAVRMRLRKKHERIENDGPNFQFRGFHLMIMSFTHSVKFTPRWC